MLWFILTLCVVLGWFVWAVVALLKLTMNSKLPVSNGWFKELIREKFIEVIGITVETIGIIIALVGAFLLYQQNQQQAMQSAEEIKVVREQIQVQLTETAKQIEAQATLSAIQYEQQQRIYIDTRRAQLLETIYGRRDCDKDDIEVCPFVASVRVRVEAAKAFTQLEREVGSRPDLSNINLSGADLIDSSFLSGIILSRAILSGTVLSPADLSKAYLSFANLSKATLSGANLSGATLWEADLSGANLIGANLIGANLIGANLSKADLSGTNLSGAILFGADLREAILSGANLRGARYDSGTQWPEGFNFRDSGAIGPQANLSGADLSGANLSGADLSGAILFGADLSGANLSEAYLGSVILNGARYDSGTQWPGGFDPQRAGAIKVEKDDTVSEKGNAP